MLVTAMLVRSKMFAKTNMTGTRWRQDPGKRCLRITATFQNPYWKYWLKRLDKFVRGEYQEMMAGFCQILPPARVSRKLSSSSWLRTRL